LILLPASHSHRTGITTWTCRGKILHRLLVLLIHESYQRTRDILRLLCIKASRSSSPTVCTHLAFLFVLGRENLTLSLRKKRQPQTVAHPLIKADLLVVKNNLQSWWASLRPRASELYFTGFLSWEFICSSRSLFTVPFESDLCQNDRNL